MLAAKNSVTSIAVKRIILTGTRHAILREILLKFDLKIRGKVPFLIPLKS